VYCGLLVESCSDCNTAAFREIEEVQPVRFKISYCAMENAFKRDLRNYPLYFLVWTGLGLFYFSQGLTQRLVWHDPTSWWLYLLGWLSGAYRLGPSEDD
jgi:hypothetical protein